MSKFLNIMKTIWSKISAFFKKNDDVFSLIWKLGVICLAVALILSVTNLITADKIKQMEKAASESAMKALITADEYKRIDNSLLLQDEDTTFFEAETDNGVVGYIVETVAKGYGGEVKIMTAIGTDKKIIAVTVLAAPDETPGLGQNITKSAFLEQLKGKTEGVSVVRNGADTEKNEIDAVTGATVSSRAVKSCIDEAFAALNKYLEITASGTVREVQ